MCTVMGSSSANYSVERCHIFHIIWAPTVGSLLPLHFYQFMISVKFGLFFFSFIIVKFINHWSHKCGIYYTHMLGLANLKVADELFIILTKYFLKQRILVRLVSPKMIELESLTPFFLFRYCQPSSKTAHSSIQTWISDWHSGWQRRHSLDADVLGKRPSYEADIFGNKVKVEIT